MTLQETSPGRVWKSNFCRVAEMTENLEWHHLAHTRDYASREETLDIITLKHTQGCSFSEKQSSIKEQRQHYGQGTIEMSVSMMKYSE